MDQDSDHSDVEMLRLERSFYLRLLELGEETELKPFLEEALALVVEIAGAKQGYLESRNVSRAQDGELAGALRNGLFLDRTLEFDAGIESAIAQLTPDDLLQALRRRLDPAKMSIVKAGDFAGAEAERPVTP